ncbi:MAG: 7,8-didemethyl-8-hydroxy-5-deazariboflavin synthase subunit CofG [Halobacteriota archaeon]
MSPQNFSTADIVEAPVETLFGAPPEHVTFSRNAFLPITNVCRNACAYCGFRRDVTDSEAHLMGPDEVDTLLRQAKATGCTEALFTFGERPYEVSGFRPWLHALGYDHTVDYLYDLCERAIAHGVLPHSNPGILTFAELEQLKPVNASMGLMLETTASVNAHRGCAGKDPELRLWTIEDAGKLRIPFTTGLLVGIGEGWDDRVHSLEVLAALHRKYRHLQEVIIQPFAPKPDTRMAGVASPGAEVMLRTVALARHLLPDDVAIQVPPNLAEIPPLLRVGASDIGGVSTVTVDYINPEHAWPDVTGLGVTLRERLPLYPQYVRAGWYSAALAPLIASLADAEGFALQRGEADVAHGR